MKVRCPACKTLHVDPEGRFSCRSCSRKLAWQAPPPLWIAEQLTLFQPTGTAEAPTLPLEHPESEPQAARSPVGISAETRQLIASSVALVTAYLALADGSDDVIPAILSDQTSEQALALAGTTAWLASMLVVQVDAAL